MRSWPGQGSFASPRPAGDRDLTRHAPRTVPPSRTGSGRTGSGRTGSGRTASQQTGSRQTGSQQPGARRTGDHAALAPPGSPEALLTAAQRALTSGRAADALRDLDDLARPDLFRSLPRPARAAVLAFRGNAQLQLGQAAAACESLRAAARLDRHDAGLACALGAALQQAGRMEEALAAFREAARRDRRHPQAPYGSGVVLHLLGRHGEAETAFRRAIELAPDLLEAWENRALTLAAAGDREAADSAWRAALDRFPPQGPAKRRLAAGLARHLAASGRPADSIPYFQAALAEDAGSGSDRDILARDLALAQLQAGQAAAAAEALARLAARAPDAELLSSLGAAHLAAGDPLAALAALQQALALDPGHRGAHLHAGHARQALGHLAEAAAHHRQALAADAAYLPAMLGLANVLTEMADAAGADAAFAQAESLLAQAGRTDPAGDAAHDATLAQLRWNRALHDLLLGRYRQGWEGYRWRWQVPDFPTPWRETGLPAWDGTATADRRLHVWGEQGPGDAVMFASCLPDLLATGAQVVLALDPRLHRLFRRSFPAVEVQAPDAPVPPADAALPIGDLPRHFRNAEADFPARTAYLAADSDAVAQWRARWQAEAGPGRRIVALSWKGGVTAAERRRRGSGLDDWAALLRLPGLAWVNLQFGADAAEAFADARARFDLTCVAGPDPGGDLDAVAAALAAADVTVSMANTLVHLAGALGGPTLVAVPAAPSWRWQRARGDSPWYPSLRLVRQEPGEAWPAVLARAATMLPDLLDSPPPSSGL